MSVNHSNRRGQVSFAFLWKVLRASLIRLLVVGVLCAGVVGALRYVTTTPTYTSQVTLYVNAANGTTAGDVLINPGNTSGARDQAEAFGMVIESSGVVDYVLQDLQSEALYGKKYKDLTKDQVASMMNVIVNTQIITLRITHPNAQTAYDVAKAFEERIPSRLDYYVSISNEEDAEKVVSVTKLMDHAELDTTPTGRGSLWYALAGFVVGVCLLYLIVFLKAWFDHTLYTEDDVKTCFDSPIMGVIPTWGESSKKKTKTPSTGAYVGHILSDKTPSEVVHAFGLLRAKLIYATKENSCAVLGVTSATTGEGKSFVASNMAMSYAHMGKRVLLIDGDLRNPVQHQIFGLEQKGTSLSELLTSETATYTNINLSSGIAFLDIVSGGDTPKHPTELLASSKMQNFITSMKEQYDVILIDLPAMGQVADAGVLSDILTGYLFVIRSGCSKDQNVISSVETMEDLGASVMGFVLNDTHEA